MSWRDMVRKSGCTAKMGTCSCEECLNKGGCPHCDGNAPKSECICGRTNKAEEYGKPTKEKIKQFCDKCGADVIVPKGTIRGSNNSYYCRRCKAAKNKRGAELGRMQDRLRGTVSPKNPFTRKD